MSNTENTPTNPVQPNNLNTLKKHSVDPFLLCVQLLDHIHEGVIITDSIGQIQYANQIAIQLLDISENESRGNTIDQFMRSKQSKKLKSDENVPEENLRKRFGIAKTQYFIFLKKNSVEVPVEYSTSLLHDAHNNLSGMLILFRDLSGRIKDEKQVMREASYDALTKLPNRYLCEETLLHMLRAATLSKENIAVIYINLDNLATIKDLLGKDAHNEIITTVATRLKKILRSGDCVAKLEGSDFVTLLYGVTDIRNISKVAEKMLMRIKNPIPVGRSEKYADLTASIGITVSKNTDFAAEKLISNAEIAMYRAKESGRNGYHFYSDSLQQQNRAHLEIESALNRALIKNEFIMHYQPIYAMDHTLVEFESLLRWEHPTKGIIPAYQFIETLEKMTLITEVGHWAIFQAIAQHKQWLNEGLITEDVSMAVNISALEFETHKIVAYIKYVIDTHHINPACIVIEVTESAIMKDLDVSASFLKKLGDLGVKLCIDDFGKGYSSLAYLKKFPVHTLKIDGMFVKEIETSTDSLSIVKAIISLAKVLNIRTVAEYVETEKQLMLLREAGCDTVQGYYWGRDLNSDAMKQLLNLQKGK